MNVLLFAIESPTIIILVVAAIFLLFGGSKLPQLAKALGRARRLSKKGWTMRIVKRRRSRIRARNLRQSTMKLYSKKRGDGRSKCGLKRRRRSSDNFGVRRQSEAATALWIWNTIEFPVNNLKRRRRFALPAHSKSTEAALSFPRPASPSTLIQTRRCVALRQ